MIRSDAIQWCDVVVGDMQWCDAVMICNGEMQCSMQRSDELMRCNGWCSGDMQRCETLMKCNDDKLWWYTVMMIVQWRDAVMNAAFRWTSDMRLYVSVMRCMERAVQWWHAIIRCNGAMQWSAAMWCDAVRICNDDAMLDMQCDAMQWGYAMMMQCWICNVMRCSAKMQWWCKVEYAMWCDDAMQWGYAMTMQC